MRFVSFIGLIIAMFFVASVANAETVEISNQRSDKVKVCTYRTDDKSLVRARKCWMMKPGRSAQWRRSEGEGAFDVRVFEAGAFELPICLKRNFSDSYRIEITRAEMKTCAISFVKQSVPVQSWNRLDRVLVNWGADRFWYPATVVNVSADSPRVRIDNGLLVQIEPRYIADLQIPPGARVEVNWKGQGRWYPGYVESFEGDMFNVQFDDGFKENSPLRRIRLDIAHAVKAEK
ncbi:agenet domain-containing protein [Parasphingorhabdus sp.]|uniref:agenet domain-containing protein n=1 Tax=Parasphingorhabdus sp. TaxID=2709688 RepID=UPI003265D56F